MGEKRPAPTTRSCHFRRAPELHCAFMRLAVGLSCGLTTPFVSMLFVSMLFVSMLFVSSVLISSPFGGSRGSARIWLISSPLHDGVAFVIRIKPFTYIWKTAWVDEGGGRHIGFHAYPLPNGKWSMSTFRGCQFLLGQRRGVVNVTFVFNLCCEIHDIHRKECFVEEFGITFAETFALRFFCLQGQWSFTFNLK